MSGALATANLAALAEPKTPQAREDALSCVMADRANILAAYHHLRAHVSRYVVQRPDIADAIARSDAIREGRP